MRFQNIALPTALEKFIKAMPKLPKDFLSDNFEGSAFVWENFKKNPALSILGSPLVLLDAALLPVRAITGRESTESDDERELERFRREQGMPGSREFAEYKGKRSEGAGGDLQPLVHPAGGRHSSSNRASTGDRKHSGERHDRRPEKRKREKPKVKRESVLYSGWSVPSRSPAAPQSKDGLRNQRSPSSEYHHVHNLHHREPHKSTNRHHWSSKGSRRRPSPSRTTLRAGIDPQSGLSAGSTVAMTTRSTTPTSSAAAPIASSSFRAATALQTREPLQYVQEQTGPRLDQPHAHYPYAPSRPNVHAIPQYPPVDQSPGQYPYIQAVPQQPHLVPRQKGQRLSARRESQQSSQLSQVEMSSHQLPQPARPQSGYQSPYVDSEVSGVSRKTFAVGQPGASVTQPDPNHQVLEWLQKRSSAARSPRSHASSGSSRTWKPPLSTILTHATFEPTNVAETVVAEDSRSQPRRPESSSRHSQSLRSAHIGNGYSAAPISRTAKTPLPEQGQPSAREPSVSTINTADLPDTVAQRSRIASSASRGTSHNTADILNVNELPDQRYERFTVPYSAPAPNISVPQQAAASANIGEGIGKGAGNDGFEDDSSSSTSSSENSDTDNSDSGSETGVPTIPGSFPSPDGHLQHSVWPPAPNPQQPAQYYLAPQLAQQPPLAPVAQQEVQQQYQQPLQYAQPVPAQEPYPDMQQQHYVPQPQFQQPQYNPGVYNGQSQVPPGPQQSYC